MKKRTDIFFPVFLLFIFAATSAHGATDLNQLLDTLAEKLASVTQGDVLKGTETQVYLAFDRHQGILPGSRFEIIRQGDPLKIGDEVVGYEETMVAEVEVVRVRDRIAICRILKKPDMPKIGVPKPGDRAYQLRKKINILMIAQFDYNRSLNRLTRSFQEKLVTAMAKLGMQVVGRDQLERVLKEQKLGYSSLVNMSSARKICKLLGAEGMLLGTVSDMDDAIIIKGRIVDIESGNTISISEMELPKTPLIAQLLKMPLKEELFVLKKSSSQYGYEKKKMGKTVQTVHNGDFTFHLKQCEKSNDTVECELLIVNNKQDRELILQRQKIRLIDNLGNVYMAAENKTFLANVSGRYQPRSILVKGIPTRAGTIFSGVAEEAQFAALVEFSFRGLSMIQFRNIRF